MKPKASHPHEFIGQEYQIISVKNLELTPHSGHSHEFIGHEYQIINVKNVGLPLKELVCPAWRSLVPLKSQESFKDLT